MQESVRFAGRTTGCCHDIRTHINILLGAIGMMEAGMLSGEQMQQYIGILRQNALTMLRLVNHLLEEKEKDTQTLPELGLCSQPQMRQYQIDDMMKRVAECIRPYAQSKGIELLYDIASPIKAFCDMEMLERVLYNLLSNAIKFTEPGGFVYISGQRSGGMVRINVADTGCGLKPSHLEALEREGEADDELGTGLRLVKSMVRGMRGQLTCISRERVGTTVYLRIPESDSGKDLQSSQEGASLPYELAASR